MGRIFLERGLMTPEPPDTPGPLAFARRPGQIEELLDAAGFDDIETDVVDFAFHAASLDEFWEQAIRRSGRFTAIVAGLEPAEHYKLRDAVDEAFAPYVGEDGRVEIPARALVAAAGA
jgi:hypothetical protein